MLEDLDHVGVVGVRVRKKRVVGRHRLLRTPPPRRTRHPTIVAQEVSPPSCSNRGGGPQDSSPATTPSETDSGCRRPPRKDPTDPATFSRMQDDPLARARAALSRGDVLIAYDEAVTALEARP